MRHLFDRRLLAASAVAVLGALSVPGAALAGVDADGDGMADRWEAKYGVSSPTGDPDRDGLRNLREYRRDGLPKDEDTDNDGVDDGDEVKDGYKSTDIGDRDTDDDGIRDGDEDADRDGVDNEDEDDAGESCAADDDDRDGDGIDDEDENEHRHSASDRDADDDGVRDVRDNDDDNDGRSDVRDADGDADSLPDGDEDIDEDGTADEDEDDDDLDRCLTHAEDDGDRYGTITSFDSSTRALQVASFGGATVVGTVNGDTEIEVLFRDEEGEYDDDEGTAADLVAGRIVAEMEFDDDTGFLEEVVLYRN